MTINELRKDNQRLNKTIRMPGITSFQFGVILKKIEKNNLAIKDITKELSVKID